MKNCAIYTRVSTDNQAEKEFSSCEAQEQKMRSFIASQNDWQVFKVYSDGGYSGATTERPALQRLLSDLKKGKIDVVLVYKIDRLTRSPKDFYQLIEFFEQSKIDFISITERFDTSTPAGRLLRNIMLTFSQFERELTSERTKDKLLERARKGMCNGGLTPYGYMRKDKKLIINTKEAEEIKSIFETYIETGSLAETYDYFRGQGIKNRLGKNFSKTNLGYILRNQLYIGKIQHLGEFYNGIHEPVISKEIFDLAQKIHKEKRKNFRVYKNFIFGGLMKCESCGSSMTPCFTNKKTGTKTKRYYYYRCTSTFRENWQGCPVKQVSAERLENYVFDNLERILADKEYIENLVFKLNNDTRVPPSSGLELSKLCYEDVSETLKFFLSEMKLKKGMDKNLLAKSTLSSLDYSPERIKISFNTRPNPADLGVDKGQAPHLLTSEGLGNRLLVGFTDDQFVSYSSAPRPGLEPGTISLHMIHNFRNGVDYIFPGTFVGRDFGI